MPQKDSKGMIDIFGKAVRVKFSDVYHIKEFYAALHEYLVENKWKDAAGDGDHWETFYMERVKQGDYREVWIRWRPKKKAEGSEYFVYHLDFDWHCIGVKATEIIVDGKKVKANSGDIEINMKIYIEKKYEKDFKEHSFLRSFLNIFNQRIYSANITQRKKEAYHEFYALQNFMKQWFRLKRYMPYEESKNFFPSFAWPSNKKW
jgi:hypothetical protein